MNILIRVHAVLIITILIIMYTALAVAMCCAVESG